ncbi:MAG: hypothetical protein WD468_02840 [Pirellulales bacterium]
MIAISKHLAIEQGESHRGCLFYPRCSSELTMEGVMDFRSVQRCSLARVKVLGIWSQSSEKKLVLEIIVFNDICPCRFLKFAEVLVLTILHTQLARGPGRRPLERGGVFGGSRRRFVALPTSVKYWASGIRRGILGHTDPHDCGRVGHFPYLCAARLMCFTAKTRANEQPQNRETWQNLNFCTVTTSRKESINSLDF